MGIEKARLLHAFGWTGGGTAFSRGIQFVRSIIVARLLSPDDYGLFGLAVAVTLGLRILTEFSLGTKIITGTFDSEEQEQRYLDTVWTLELVRGALLCLFVLLMAWPASWFLKDGRLLLVFLLLSIGPLVTGFQNAGLIKLRRNLRFKELAFQQQSAEFVSFFITVVAALTTRNYLALVISLLVFEFLKVGFSYVFCRYRPTLIINWRAAADCFHFGKHLFLIGILTFVTTQFDNLVVGRMMGSAVLGAYLLAYELAMMPMSVLGTVLNSVLTPAYSETHRNDPSKLIELFLRMNLIGALLLAILGGPLALIPGMIIRFLYGDQWSNAGDFLAVLVLAGVFRGLVHTIAPVLVAIERPDLGAKCKAFETILFVILTMVLVNKYGAIGAAWGGVACYSLAYLLRILIVVRVSTAQGRNVFGRVLAPIGVGAIAYLTAFYSMQVAGSAIIALICYMAVLLGVVYAANSWIRQELADTAGAFWRLLTTSR